MIPQTEPEAAAERAAFAAVDAALRTQPLRSAPPELAAAVMASVRATGGAAPARITFRLTWIDYALPAFATLMAALALLAWRMLTPETAARLWIRVVVLLQQANGLVWALALAGVVLAGGLAALAALVFRPRGLMLRR